MSTTNLAKALLAAQREFPAIHKTATNPFHKSTYAPLDAVLAAVVPSLNKHGIVLTQFVTAPDRNEAGGVVSITVVTRLLHESGEYLDSPVVMPLVKSDPQGAGAAITYARRYSLQMAVGVTAEDDDDGNHASQVKKPAPRREAGVPPAASNTKPTPASGPVWPFGDDKGKPLTQLTNDQLGKGLDWLKSKNDKGQFDKLITQVETEIDARNNAE